MASETPTERAERERVEDADKARRLKEQRAGKQKPRGGPLSNLLSLGPPQGCESNYDCERPQVCCDLVVARVCCSSGQMIGGGAPTEGPFAGLAPSLMPIPIPVEGGQEQMSPREGPGSANGFPGPSL